MDKTGAKMQACEKCAAGPTGAEGHENLFTYSFAGPQVGMKCRVCGSMWLRKYEDGSTFSWTPSTLSEGALLP
jgi:hypothetical protein